jgi:hypothetical protein
MLNRTKRSTIRFSSEVSLIGIEQILPAGDYSIVEDEELIEGLSWAAYRRTGTFIEVPAALSSAHAVQIFEINREELDAAISQGIASLGTDPTEDRGASSDTT